MKVYCVWLIDQSTDDEKNLIVICDSAKSAFDYVEKNYGSTTYLKREHYNDDNVIYKFVTRKGPDEYFIDIVENEVYEMKGNERICHFKCDDCNGTEKEIRNCK